MLFSKFLCWGLMFFSLSTWPKHIILEGFCLIVWLFGGVFFVIKVFFGPISSRRKAPRSTPALCLFKSVSLLVPHYEHWPHQSVTATCVIKGFKMPHESSLWRRQENPRHPLQHFDISKYSQELSLEIEAHRTPRSSYPPQMNLASLPMGVLTSSCRWPAAGDKSQWYIPTLQTTPCIFLKRCLNRASLLTLRCQWTEEVQLPW